MKEKGRMSRKMKVQKWKKRIKYVMEEKNVQWER